MSWCWRFVGGGVLLLLASTVQSAPSLRISPIGYRLEQVTPVAGQSRTFDLTARAGVNNFGDPALSVTAQLSSSLSTSRYSTVS
jgi:hypothetical protein